MQVGQRHVVPTFARTGMATWLGAAAVAFAALAGAAPAKAAPVSDVKYASGVASATVQGNVGPASTRMAVTVDAPKRAVSASGTAVATLLRTATTQVQVKDSGTLSFKKGDGIDLSHGVPTYTVTQKVGEHTTLKLTEHGGDIGGSAAALVPVGHGVALQLNARNEPTPAPVGGDKTLAWRELAGGVIPAVSLNKGPLHLEAKAGATFQLIAAPRAGVDAADGFAVAPPLMTSVAAVEAFAPGSTMLLTGTVRGGASASVSAPVSGPLSVQLGGGASTEETVSLAVHVVSANVVQVAISKLSTDEQHVDGGLSVGLGSLVAGKIPDGKIWDKVEAKLQGMELMGVNAFGKNVHSLGVDKLYTFDFSEPGARAAFDALFASLGSDPRAAVAALTAEAQAGGVGITFTRDQKQVRAFQDELVLKALGGPVIGTGSSETTTTQTHWSTGNEGVTTTKGDATLEVFGPVSKLIRGAVKATFTSSAQVTRAAPAAWDASVQSLTGVAASVGLAQTAMSQDSVAMWRTLFDGTAPSKDKGQIAIVGGDVQEVLNAARLIDPSIITDGKVLKGSGERFAALKTVLEGSAKAGPAGSDGLSDVTFRNARLSRAVKYTLDVKRTITGSSSARYLFAFAQAVGAQADAANNYQVSYKGSRTQVEIDINDVGMRAIIGASADEVKAAFDTVAKQMHGHGIPAGEEDNLRRFEQLQTGDTQEATALRDTFWRAHQVDIGDALDLLKARDALLELTIQLRSANVPATQVALLTEAKLKLRDLLGPAVLSELAGRDGVDIHRIGIESKNGTRATFVEPSR